MQRSLISRRLLQADNVIISVEEYERVQRLRAEHAALQAKLDAQDKYCVVLPVSEHRQLIMVSRANLLHEAALFRAASSRGLL